MKKFRENLSESDRLFFFYGVSFLALFTIFRILFFSIYSYRIQELHLTSILQSFLIGIRFDLATIGMLLGVCYILSQIPYLNRFSFFRFIWSFPPLPIFAWCIGHLSGDLLYYENANKHIGYEAVVFLGDLPILIKSAFQENPIAAGLTSAAILCFFAAAPYFYGKNLFPKENKQKSLLSSSLRLLLSFLIVGILVRGGVQETPLRASNAIHTNDTLINNIPLNGIYTTIMDFKSQSIPESLRMDLNEAASIVKKEIDYEGAEFINHPDYPILRKQKETNPGIPPNIVLVLQESWTGKFVWPITDGKVNGKELAPFYNKIAKQGHSFKNFFANGGRTSNGLLSILTGIPDRPGLTAVRTHQVLGNFSGLGNIFQKWGYETIFVTGDDLQFDSLGTILPHWGFQKLIGKKEIESLNKYKIGAWGYDDQDLFEILKEEMDLSHRKGKPFLGTVLTMTTHYPYKVPDPKFEIFDASVPDYDYLNTYHYADWAISDFISKAEKSPYFKNTIFVFVADHTHHRYLNYFEDRNVPLLFWSRGKIKPKLDERQSSQLDVLPTILGLVGKETLFSAMGRNLFAPNNDKSSAYFAYGAAFGWVENNQFFYRWVDGNKDFIFTAYPPYTEHRECHQTPVLCLPSFEKSKAFFNVSLELMNRNKVFPGGAL